MTSNDQKDIFAFLADPSTHGLSEPVIRIDTHANSVFLAGRDVYKVKRAVQFPFLDQSTLERRRTACQTEVRVNRHFTPKLYLGIVPITREGATFSIGGPGEVAEWAVHLKRFDETATFDLIAARGEMTSAMIVRIADMILDSHRLAKASDGDAATAALAKVIDETLREITEAPEIFAASRAADLAANMGAAYDNGHELLLARGAHGFVRRCHGDLHLRNIVLLDRGPALFDAIEFDESIATTDIYYDLAFALMDLWQCGMTSEANLLLNRYLWRCDDLTAALDGLALLPLFLSLRAAVLAKISAIRSRDAGPASAALQEARRYFEVAVELLTPVPPVLVAIGGLSGSGKSVTAARFAAKIGRAPGAVHLRSDIERKRQLGVPDLQRLPQSGYTMAVTEQVFAALRDQAGQALRAGQSVVVDAVHRNPAERDMIAAVARRAGARFVGLWLDAPVDVLTARVEQRTGDASDATVGVVERQAQTDIGPLAWVRIDASQNPAAVVKAAIAACETARDIPD